MILKLVKAIIQTEQFSNQWQGKQIPVGKVIIKGKLYFQAKFFLGLPQRFLQQFFSLFGPTAEYSPQLQDLVQVLFTDVRVRVVVRVRAVL